MTPGLVVGLVAAPALGLLTALLTRPTLRWLPEPGGQPDKTPYADLGAPPFVLVTALLATASAAVAAVTVTATLLPVWWVLSSVGGLLVAVDARTTWLPLPLTRLGWCAMTAALLAVGVLDGWSAALRGLVGAGLAGGLYLLVWRLSRGGFGFGDVRFAPLLGAVTACGSWTLLLWGLALGSLAGGAQGLVRLLRRRRDGFAYAPAMFAGVYLASALTWLAS